MNRTREEIANHAQQVGYTKDAILKISGFLIGVGIKEEDEVIVWRVGDKTWSDFFDWFNNKKRAPLSVFDTIAEDIFKRLDESTTEAEKERYRKQLNWLCKHHIKTVDNRDKCVKRK